MNLSKMVLSVLLVSMVTPLWGSVDISEFYLDKDVRILQGLFAQEGDGSAIEREPDGDGRFYVTDDVTNCKQDIARVLSPLSNKKKYLPFEVYDYKHISGEIVSQQGVDLDVFSGLLDERSRLFVRSFVNPSFSEGWILYELSRPVGTTVVDEGGRSVYEGKSEERRSSFFALLCCQILEEEDENDSDSETSDSEASDSEDSYHKVGDGLHLRLTTGGEALDDEDLDSEDLDDERQSIIGGKAHSIAGKFLGRLAGFIHWIWSFFSNLGTW